MTCIILHHCHTRRGLPWQGEGLQLRAKLHDSWAGRCCMLCKNRKQKENKQDPPSCDPPDRISNVRLVYYVLLLRLTI
jgi:hypothetical protein